MAALFFQVDDGCRRLLPECCDTPPERASTPRPQKHAVPKLPTHPKCKSVLYRNVLVAWYVVDPQRRQCRR
uniref:Uncharacterized protein n=1 Tax=Ixodes ricinus TaxID=34613 RepID=A0A131Y6Q4_IXORI